MIDWYVIGGLGLLGLGLWFFVLWMHGGPLAWHHERRAARLDAQCRYGDAIPVYEKALKATPRWLRFARTGNLIRLGLAAFNAGRPADALRYADEALLVPPPRVVESLAHLVAGLACVELGDLERSERHRQEAFNIAEKAGNRDLAADHLAQLANVKVLRGHIGDAIATARYAAQMSAKARRMALMVEAECHQLRGDWNEARRAAQEARAVSKFPSAALEARSQATLVLLLAWIEAESGNVFAARHHLQEGRAPLQQDEKLRLWCDATDAWLCALERQTEAAGAAVADVAGRMTRFEADRSTQSLCAAMAGYATFELGEFAQSKTWWERYLQWAAHPVYQVTGRSELGECLLRLGDPAGARDEFHRALSFGLDTHRTRLCRARLAELEPGRGGTGDRLAANGRGER